MTTETDVAALGEAFHEHLLGLTETKEYRRARDKFADDMWEYTVTQVLDRMSEILEGHIRQTTSEALEAIIAGDESRLRRCLGLDGYTGRSREGDPRHQHPVIHGDLFEGPLIALRRKIAEAHPVLIRNERVRDLEDQVASLTSQVAEAQQKLEERYRP